MAEKFRFFDAVQDEFGQHDREYNAQEFTDYFKALVTTGIMKGAGNELKVTANDSNMITKVDTGIAFLLGRYYENDSFKELTHDTETLGNSRIDRIVVRMDLATEARYVKTFIKKGVPSTNPVAPTLTQTANLYEISLAQVRVFGGQTFIASDAVTDERGKDVICPWAGSKILPNFNDDGLEQIVGDVNTLNNDVGVLNGKIDLKANKIQENWITGITNNGWTATPSLKYMKDEMGFVHVNVEVTGGIKTIGTQIFELPVGYRPKSYELFGLPTYDNATNGRIVTAYFSGGGFILNGTPLNKIIIRITFKAEG